MVQKAIQDASGGKVNVNLDNGNNGLSIKGSDGTAIISNASAKPNSVPSDLPSVDGAKDFGWFGSAEGGMFAYSAANADYKAVCAQQIDLLTKAGWAKSDAYAMDVEKLMIRSMEKTGFTLSLSCSTDDDGKTAVTMTKSKNNS